MTKKKLYYSTLGFLPTDKVRQLTNQTISESRSISIKEARNEKVVYPKELKVIYAYFGYEPNLDKSAM